MLHLNRSFAMKKFFTFITIFVLVFSFSFSLVFAQEDTEEAVVVQDETEETIEAVPVSAGTAVEAADPLTITNVLSHKIQNGSLMVTWGTNNLAAGAITVLYREKSNGLTGEVVQMRLATGEFTNEHRYILRGLPAGEYAVIVESIGVDMQYDRFTGAIMVPFESKPMIHIQYVMLWLIALALIVLLVVLYEVLRHQTEFRKALETKKDKKPTRRRRKTTTKRSTKKK